MASDSVKRKLLTESKTVAIVGLSDKPNRASNMIGQYLQSKGYRIVPVNPGLESVLGEKSYPNLSSIPFPVDIVDVFRRNEEIPAIIDEAIKLNIPAIWLQPGLKCPEKQDAVQEKGTIMVDNCCIKVEHQFLIG